MNACLERINVCGKDGTIAPRRPQGRRRSADTVEYELNAYHAAGHIVLGCMHGFRAKRVVIPSSGERDSFQVALNESSFGFYFYNRGWPAGDGSANMAERAIGMAETLLAGYCAMVRN